MQFSIRKEMSEPAETSQTFTHSRDPLQQRKYDNLPFVTQIQDLMATLIRKKNQVKQLKLVEANLKAKGQQQEDRIQRLQIEMDHQIVKQEASRNRMTKLEREAFWHKETIRQLSKEIQMCKNQAVQTLNSITKIKKTISDTINCSISIEAQIEEKQNNKRDWEDQIQNLDTMICRTENSTRQKQDILTSAKIQETQINSMLAYIQQRSMLTMKTRNKVLQNNQILDRDIIAAQNKITCLNREAQELDWTCEQIYSQNQEVEDLNSKLISDLEAVHKHLFTMQKMNKMLQQALDEYSITGVKVSRMINITRSQS